MPILDRHPIIVLGMHRSGTSLVARILDDMGVNMGQQLEANHEAVLFLNINRALLNQADAYWANPSPFLQALHTEQSAEHQNAERFIATCQNLVMTTLALKRLFSPSQPADSATPWGWKDPRNTLTLPIWLKCFPHAKVIHVVRNGLDVALSLHRREVRQWVQRRRVEKHLWPPTIGAAYRLWTIYLAAAQHNIPPHADCLCLRYEDLLHDPHQQLERLAAFVRIQMRSTTRIRIIAERLRPPSQRSRWDVMRLGLLTRTGCLDLQPLLNAGYSP